MFLFAVEIPQPEGQQPHGQQVDGQCHIRDLQHEIPDPHQEGDANIVDGRIERRAEFRRFPLRLAMAAELLPAKAMALLLLPTTLLQLSQQPVALVFMSRASS